MSSTHRQEFEGSLSAADATVTTTTVADFETELCRVVTEPAVGAELPYPDLTLTETSVTCGPSPTELRTANTGVTAAPLGIASLGTVAVHARWEGDEPVSLFPERHVVVIRETDIVPDLEAAFEWLTETFASSRESIVFATGPSATGDMGGLVQGVHGPREVHVVIIENNE